MAESVTFNVIFYAMLGGFVPTLLWLWFWLHEDRKRPEPKGLIALTFFTGMLAVPIAIFLENFTQEFLPILFQSIAAKVLIWAAIEETLKFLAVFIGPFETKFFDEPIDAVVYMITAALGFAALENTLFLIGAFHTSGLLGWFGTGNSRFLGATVLHTVSSGLIGAAVGLTFYRKRIIQIGAVVLGLLTATLLHGSFNFFIIESEGKNIMEVFFILWVVTVLAMVIFEKVRRMRPVK